MVININLHQSNAGIGNKLKTHKFIDITAHIINIKIIQALIELLIKSTIHIGQLTCLIASSLSLGVSGLNIFFTNIHIHLNVNKV
jgi:hypothetical protein